MFWCDCEESVTKIYIDYTRQLLTYEHALTGVQAAHQLSDKDIGRALLNQKKQQFVFLCVK